MSTIGSNARKKLAKLFDIEPTNLSKIRFDAEGTDGVNVGLSDLNIKAPTKQQGGDDPKWRLEGILSGLFGSPVTCNIPPDGRTLQGLILRKSNFEYSVQAIGEATDSAIQEAKRQIAQLGKHKDRPRS